MRTRQERVATDTRVANDLASGFIWRRHEGGLIVQLCKILEKMYVILAVMYKSGVLPVTKTTRKHALPPESATAFYHLPLLQIYVMCVHINM